MQSPRGPWGRFGMSFYYAFAGVSRLFRTQRNARIELALGIAACGLAAWLHINTERWAILLLTIAIVLILEGLNTSIEIAIDLACPEHGPRAKAAKDLAAGMVLIASIASMGIGLLILGIPLWRRLGL
jgi:diacylglycerol kinase